MTITIHNIEKIEISKIRKHSIFCEADLTITQSDGKVITIDLFSDSRDEDKLKVKKVKVKP